MIFTVGEFIEIALRWNFIYIQIRCVLKRQRHSCHSHSRRSKETPRRMRKQEAGDVDIEKKFVKNQFNPIFVYRFAVGAFQSTPNSFFYSTNSSMLFLLFCACTHAANARIDSPYKAKFDFLRCFFCFVVACACDKKKARTHRRFDTHEMWLRLSALRSHGHLFRPSWAVSWKDEKNKENENATTKLPSTCKIIQIEGWEETTKPPLSLRSRRNYGIWLWTEKNKSKSSARRLVTGDEDSDCCGDTKDVLLN